MSLPTPLTVSVCAGYDVSADELFAAAIDFRELRRAMKGLASYDGLPLSGEMAAGETYVTDIRFWGLLPVRGHTIRVDELNREARRLVTSERHAGIRQWRHEVEVSPRLSGERGAIWTDTVTIDAGRPTPFVARFARHVYLRRHRMSRATGIRSRLLIGPPPG